MDTQGIKITDTTVTISTDIPIDDYITNSQATLGILLGRRVELQEATDKNETDILFLQKNLDVAVKVQPVPIQPLPSQPTDSV